MSSRNRRDPSLPLSSSSSPKRSYRQQQQQQRALEQTQASIGTTSDSSEPRSTLPTVASATSAATMLDHDCQSWGSLELTGDLTAAILPGLLPTQDTSSNNRLHVMFEPTPIGPRNTMNVVKGIALNESPAFSTTTDRSLHQLLHGLIQAPPLPSPPTAATTERTRDESSIFQHGGGLQSSLFSSKRTAPPPQNVSLLEAGYSNPSQLSSNREESRVTGPSSRFLSMLERSYPPAEQPYSYTALQHQVVPPKKRRRTDASRGRRGDDSVNNFCVPMNSVGSGTSKKVDTVSSQTPSSTLQKPDQWQERFDELVQFRNQHGHCLVPLDYEQNPRLGHWVKRQRTQWKLKFRAGESSCMSEERESALKRVGFVWDTYEASWEERYQDLCSFKLTNGHCNVPSDFANNAPLASWVKRQRHYYKRLLQGRDEKDRSKMTPSRISKLNLIGFEWNPRNLKLPPQSRES